VGSIKCNATVHWYRTGIKALGSGLNTFHELNGPAASRPYTENGPRWPFGNSRVSSPFRLCLIYTE
jgi:hypothetical protein